jgi:hypothetical protein
MHDVSPTWSWNDPGAHGEGARAPAVSTNVPVGAGLHGSLPFTGLYVPGRHGWGGVVVVVVDVVVVVVVVVGFGDGGCGTQPATNATATAVATRNPRRALIAIDTSLPNAGTFSSSR